MPLEKIITVLKYGLGQFTKYNNAPEIRDCETPRGQVAMSDKMSDRSSEEQDVIRFAIRETGQLLQKPGVFELLLHEAYGHLRCLAQFFRQDEIENNLP